ncbi:helix-turn-helix domain-containing protein [Actinoallomurus vinaceus]|uniref:Helix-turn-helix domain-containing protein n=1 Tax=Actinoallomurus vinaceus TaxID=1080074 RepID=A0ABP8UWB1_9ACTN
MYTEVPAPDLLCAGRFDEKPGFTVYREHGARNWMLSLTVTNTADYWADGQHLVTRPGDLVLITPGAVQHYRASPDGGPWGYWWAHFQPRAAWFSWLRLPEISPGFSLTRLAGDRLAEAVAAFERVHRNAMQSTMDVGEGRLIAPSRELTGMFATELALNAIEQILLLAVVEHEQRKKHLPDPRIQCVLDRIVADPARQVTIEELARSVSLSPSRLSHLFRQEVGNSIVNVVLATRLRKAASLLEFSDHPVGRIAADVGFSSPYYFSRQFRSRFGESPSAYRARVRRHEHA